MIKSGMQRRTLELKCKGNQSTGRTRTSNRRHREERKVLTNN
jgi:hypothetical protein